MRDIDCSPSGSDADTDSGAGLAGAVSAGLVGHRTLHSARAARIRRTGSDILAAAQVVAIVEAAAAVAAAAAAAGTVLPDSTPWYCIKWDRPV